MSDFCAAGTAQPPQSLAVVADGEGLRYRQVARNDNNNSA
jgi:hypothetical protein